VISVAVLGSGVTTVVDVDAVVVGSVVAVGVVVVDVVCVAGAVVACG